LSVTVGARKPAPTSVRDVQQPPFTHTPT
jgi:hypothetical protein